jgi:hypothetical protein
MAYSKAKLKSNGDRTSPYSDNSEQEMHRTNIYLHGFCCRFHVKYILINLISFMPVTVAVRSETWVLAGWLLGSWVRIALEAWMFVRVFLCCVVLCR